MGGTYSLIFLKAKNKEIFAQLGLGRHSERSATPALLLEKVPLPILAWWEGGGGRAGYSRSRVDQCVHVVQNKVTAPWIPEVCLLPATA